MLNEEVQVQNLIVIKRSLHAVKVFSESTHFINAIKHNTIKAVTQYFGA